MKHIISHCWNSSKIQSQTLERGNIDTPNTHIHNHSLSWLGTDTSVRSDRVKIA